MQPALPPYALTPTAFRFPALAALAGRAPLGGHREVALATYLVARLAQDVLADNGVSDSARTERAAGAKNWLSTMGALPAPVRAPMTKAIDASTGSAAAAADALRNVISVTASYLDSRSRSELDQLADSLGAKTSAG